MILKKITDAPDPYNTEVGGILETSNEHGAELLATKAWEEVK